MQLYLKDIQLVCSYGISTLEYIIKYKYIIIKESWNVFVIINTIFSYILQGLISLYYNTV